MPDHEETETRHVSLEEIRAGIKLHAGHPVVLIVSDASKIGTSEIDASGETGPATPSLLGSLEAAHFETAKAFPLEGALPSFRAVAALATAEPKRTLLIVGHTDTVGKAEDNLKLSGERAAAVSAYLRSDVDEWMPFYAHAEAQKKWGVREDQHMLSALPYGGHAYYTGEIDGLEGPKTKAAWEKLQSAHALSVTGKADDASRRGLVLEYMQAEGTTLPDSCAIETLACGDRHLAENTGRGVESQMNRRVDVFAFEGSPVVPAPSECTSAAHPRCSTYDRWKKEVKGAIGEKDPAPQAAEVWLEFDEHAVLALADGALTLSGEGIPEQVVPLAQAERANGAARVRFAWDDRSRKVTVEASAGERKVVLLANQAAGDPRAPLSWSGHLEELLTEDPAQAGSSIIGSMGDSDRQVAVVL